MIHPLKSLETGVINVRTDHSFQLVMLVEEIRANKNMAAATLQSTSMPPSTSDLVSMPDLPSTQRDLDDPAIHEGLSQHGVPVRKRKLYMTGAGGAGGPMSDDSSVSSSEAMDDEP